MLGTMPMTLDQIVEETRQLPQDVRTDLVERILLAGHGGISPKIEEAWTKETRRRVDEIQSGQARGIPFDEALAEARQHAGL